MSQVVAHNITSPLGTTSEQNYQAVKSGRSVLRWYADKWQLPEGFTASLFADGEAPEVEGCTRFESMAIASARAALATCDIDVASARTVLIVSTTKGNVELLDGMSEVDEREYPGSAASVIASRLGITTTPIVVCNACISGVAALVLADRLLTAKIYDAAIVVGADSHNRFIVSGFQSFKALSPTACRPFDAERDGLNLGEAAATICLRASQGDEPSEAWHIVRGVVRNDANHISGPSRTGEGSYRALREVLDDESCLPTGRSLAFVNVHGTATAYNDEMESIALERAGLSATPINALKGYYGHTMGAAGILETIISMMAADDHTVLATRGYTSKGVSGNIQVNSEHKRIEEESFIKLLSGFGGCNAAIKMSKHPSTHTLSTHTLPTLNIHHRVHITTNEVTIEGSVLPTSATGQAMLTEVYRAEQMSYAKFFKMDTLSRLGFVASELLLRSAQLTSETLNGSDDCAVILFNRTSSIVADRQHQALIADSANFYPSPSVFVYTLPNIVTGEIAIRNRMHGETSLYILPQRDDELMHQIYRASLLERSTRHIIGGWIDCLSNDDFEAELMIIENNTHQTA